MMLIGKQEPCACAARVATLICCPCRLSLAKRLPPISRSGAPSAPTVDCSYVRGHPFGASKPRWQCSLSLGTHSPEPGSMRPPKVHISSGTPWRARCCVGALHCPRSVRYWTTAIPKRLPFTRRSICLRCTPLLWPGREGRDDQVAEIPSGLPQNAARLGIQAVRHWDRIARFCRVHGAQASLSYQDNACS